MVGVTTERIPSPHPDPVHERSIAVLPFVVAGAVLAAGVMGALVIASLAVTPAPQGPHQAVAPPAVSPAPDPSPAAPDLVPDALPPAGPNQCLDHAGDAVIDLLSVRLESDRRGTVLARFEFAGALPSGPASISLLTEGARNSYRFTARWSDGELEGFSVFEVGDEDRDRLAWNAVTVHGSTAVMRLPSKHVNRLGGAWSWSAFTGVDGLLDDSCGDGLIPFERGDRHDD